MIDAPALPNIGEHLRLIRAEVEIGRKVVWRSDYRWGVEFEGRISIDDWIAGKCISSHRAVGQARVDEIQRLVRAGRLLMNPKNPPQIAATLDTALDIRIAEELGYVGRLLEAVVEPLSSRTGLIRSWFQNGRPSRR